MILSRADAGKENMGLTTWKGSIVRQQDITVAKNYLTHDELDTLNRLVTIFLETAELRVKERNDLTIGYWKKTVDSLLAFHGKEVLKGNGPVTKREMEQQVHAVYEDFNARRKAYEARLADGEELKLLDDLENRARQNDPSH